MPRHKRPARSSKVSTKLLSAKIRRARERKLIERRRRHSTEMPLWARPGYLIRRLHQIHYAIFFEECAKFDITPVQYGLLTVVSVNPDIDQNSLAQELGLDRTNAADVVARLAARGLLKRCRSSQDRRMVLARLTTAGENVRQNMYGAMKRAQDRLLQPLASAKRKAFIDTLLLLIESSNHLARTVYKPGQRASVVRAAPH